MDPEESRFFSSLVASSSGFRLRRICCEERRKYRSEGYFLRRVTRLEPPYIVALLIRLPLLYLVMHKPLSFIVIHGFASLFYLHSLIFGQMSAINPPAWSLEVEIQFYCLAPILAFSYFRLSSKWLRRIVGIAFILVVGILQAFWLQASPDGRASLSLLNYVQYFFAGFILCDFYLTDWESIPQSWIWDLVSAVAWSWIFLAGNPMMHLFLPFAALIACLGAFKGRLYRVFFRLSWVTVIGGMCYSIYLTHNLALTGVDLVMRPFKTSWNGTLTAVVAYALALSAKSRSRTGSLHNSGTSLHG